MRHGWALSFQDQRYYFMPNIISWKKTKKTDVACKNNNAVWLLQYRGWCYCLHSVGYILHLLVVFEPMIFPRPECSGIGGWSYCLLILAIYPFFLWRHCHEWGLIYWSWNIHCIYTLEYKYMRLRTLLRCCAVLLDFYISIIRLHDLCIYTVYLYLC